MQQSKWLDVKSEKKQVQVFLEEPEGKYKKNLAKGKEVLLSLSPKDR